MTQLLKGSNTREFSGVLEEWLSRSVRSCVSFE